MIISYFPSLSPITSFTHIFITQFTPSSPFYLVTSESSATIIIISPRSPSLSIVPPRLFVFHYGRPNLSWIRLTLVFITELTLSLNQPFPFSSLLFSVFLSSPPPSTSSFPLSLPLFVIHPLSSSLLLPLVPSLYPFLISTLTFHPSFINFSTKLYETAPPTHISSASDYHLFSYLQSPSPKSSPLNSPHPSFLRQAPPLLFSLNVSNQVSSSHRLLLFVSLGPAYLCTPSIEGEGGKGESELPSTFLPFLIPTPLLTSNPGYLLRKNSLIIKKTLPKCLPSSSPSPLTYLSTDFILANFVYSQTFSR